MMISANKRIYNTNYDNGSFSQEYWRRKKRRSVIDQGYLTV